MDLTIKIDKRSKGFTWQKQPHGANVCIAKATAIKDMNFHYKQQRKVNNYIQYEYILMHLNNILYQARENGLDLYI